MTTTDSSTTAHSSMHNDSVYDSDDALPRGSPGMKAHRLSLRLSPSPPPIIPIPQVSPPTSPHFGNANGRAKIRPSQGDAVLVAFLDGGRRPEIARTAGSQPLPSEEDESCSTGSAEREDPVGKAEEPGQPRGLGARPSAPSRVMRGVSTKTAEDGSVDLGLQALAGNALAALELTNVEASPGNERPRTAGIDGGPGNKASSRAPPPPELRPTAMRRDGAPSEDRSSMSAAASPYSPRDSRDMCSPQHPHSGQMHLHNMQPPQTNGLSNGHGELPPILSMSPKSDANGYSTQLPSIRAQLGDLPKFSPDGHDRHSGAPYPHSPPGNFPRIASMSVHSPPVSPNDLRHSQGLHPVSPNFWPGAQRTGDYPSSVETPSTEHSASTPATTISSGHDHMSISSLTNPPGGVWTCKFAGCSAPPFQTQYLLNSHANVHSSARPHFCPVEGCSRSEGGKGFKRKNEMIRHGLVHDSPGYVCPFCPEREHKYPRPDNLQRHVRVHHVDKDKDDPMLRGVLAQRPDGPSKGRRRRGIPS